jgi:uncharacterized protein (UPF0335 family)
VEDLTVNVQTTVGADLGQLADIARAKALVTERGKCSVSELQSKFDIGFNAASRIIEALEAEGVVSAPNHNGDRTVIAKAAPAADEAAPAFKSRRKIPMKETEADKEVADATYRVTANELRGFVERVERLNAEIKDLMGLRTEVLAEAKSRGYDAKCLKRVIADRRRDKDALAEEEAVLDLYREALGM